MNDLTVEDLLLMLLAQPRERRNHSNNLDLFKTLFEREIAGVNLIFNLVMTIGGAFVIAIIGAIVSQIVVGTAKFDAALWGTAGISLAAIIGIIVAVYLLGGVRRRRRQRYIHLIRLYYYLDGVT